MKLLKLNIKRPSLRVDVSISQLGRLCLAGFFALLLTACQGKAAIYKAAEAPDIVRWSKPGEDIVSIMSEEPNECLASHPSEAEIMGRLAFRSPFLLGGQAARRGLTCQACHGQGQVNENFFVIGLSETPGTADVTSFHFSDVLGDESFNPVPIPNLSDDIEGVDFSPDMPDLDVFVTRLITKEFTGPEPSPDVQKSLLAYLRGLTAQPCDLANLKQEALLAYKLRIISQSFDTLSAANMPEDTYKFMVAALRIEIGRLHARFPNDKALQTKLANMSRMIKPAAPELLAAAQARWAPLSQEFKAAYKRSLFSPDIILEWAAARRQ